MPAPKPTVIAQKEQFENLFEYSPYAIFIHDFKKIVKVNRTFLNLFGYKKKEDILGKPSFTIVFTEDKKIVEESRKSASAEMQFFIPNIRLVKADGSIFTAEAHVSSITMDEKPHLRIYVRDITESKIAEMKLLESGRKFRTLFENSLDGIYKSTPEGKFVDVNPALVEMLGYDSEEELLAIDIKTQLYFRIEDRKIMAANEEDQYPLKRKDGSKIWVEDHSYYEYDENGDIAFHHGILRDVTGKLQKQKELEKLLEVTEDQNKKLQNFAHIISHNIRSHSANLSSIVHLMQDKKSKVEEAQLFDMLKTSTHKLEETIQNLNEILTINQNLNKPFERRNLEKEVTNTLKVLSGDIIRNSIEISIEVSPNLEVKVIPAYLDSILLNLISNAIKYRKPGVTPHIWINAKKEHDFTVLEISDNGIGIDLKKNADKLFRMYETFHNKKDSRGFGLYITKNQIEAMSGKIEVKSKPGEGSIFTILF